MTSKTYSMHYLAFRGKGLSVSFNSLLSVTSHGLSDVHRVALKVTMCV